MKSCFICGNEIDDRASICPFCDTPQSTSTSGPKRTGTTVRKVVVKDGNPTTQVALDRLKEAILKGRNDQVKVLKIVHGYGSSGVGGAIKTAVIKQLRKWKQDGSIRNYLTGEEHFDRGARHNYLLRKYPELQETWISDRGNPGITFVEL